MKLTKRQLKRIIKEEKQKLLKESRLQGDAPRFKEIMEEIAELVEEAWEVSGRPEHARGYWYNGILARVDPSAHGMASRNYSMSSTYEELGGDEGKMEDMMELGYMDGLNNVEPQHPDNEYYMFNWKDGKQEAKETSRR
tara:strand:- start:60047 stop:60463 length:417 start_codon:yes stop_codon:yes gene_type:complete